MDVFIVVILDATEIFASMQVYTGSLIVIVQTFVWASLPTLSCLECCINRCDRSVLSFTN